MSAPKQLLIVLSLGLTITLSGCAWIESSSINPQVAGSGIVYYLPMKQVRAVFERNKAASPAVALQNLGQAQQAQAAAALNFRTLTGENEALSARITALTSGGLTTKDKELKDLLVARSQKAVDLVAAGGALTRANKALTAAQQAFLFAQNSGPNQCYEHISITPMAAVADTGQRYALNAEHAVSRSETAKIVTTASGLLTNVDAKATDETATIIVELARSIGAATGARAIVPAAGAGCTISKISHVLDPIDQEAWTRFTDTISSRASATYTIEPVLTGFDAKARGLLTSKNGIAYRREIPLDLKICKGADCTAANLAEIISINVPNHSPTEVLPVSVGLFGETDLDATFSDGVLIDATQTRSSELAEIASLPFRVIQALADGVSQVIQLKIDQTSQETTLSQGELELLEAEKALRDFEQEAFEAGPLEP